MLERVTVTGYVTPLREGGSLPGLVEADNLGTYVLKFRGAGHGSLALVAEIIAGELARRLGLRTPELALAWHPPNLTDPSSHTEVFEYALIRVVPRVERGEAINAGVLVYAKSFRYLGCAIELDEARLLALDPSTDVTAGPAAELDRLFTTLVRT